LVGKATTDTLTNKTLTSPVINGATIGTSIINLAINAQTGTTYTPVLADNGKLVTLSNASAITLTVPTEASVAYATGAQINIEQIGAGQVTVVGDTGVTVNGTGTKLRTQWSAATLVKLGTDSLDFDWGSCLMPILGIIATIKMQINTRQSECCREWTITAQAQ
jgi:hypothetical protein